MPLFASLIPAYSLLFLWIGVGESKTTASSAAFNAGSSAALVDLVGNKTSLETTDFFPAADTLTVERSAGNPRQTFTLGDLFGIDNVNPEDVQALLDKAREQAASNHALALDYALQAVQIAERWNEPSLQLEAYRRAGALAMTMGLTEVSAEFYGKMLEVGRQLDNKRQIAYAYFNLGSIHLIVGQNEEAKQQFLKSFDLLSDVVRTEGSSLTLMERLSFIQNLGLVHSELGEYEESNNYFSEGLTLARSTASESDAVRGQLAILLSGYGMSLVQQKRASESLPILQEALEIHQSANNLTGVATALLFLGQGNEALGILDQAGSMYLKGYEIGQEVKNIGLMKHLAEALSKLYTNSGEIGGGLHYLKLYNQHTEEENASAAKVELARAELLDGFHQRQLELGREILKRRALTGVLFLLLVLVPIGIGYLVRRQKHGLEEAKNDSISQARQNLRTMLTERISNGENGQWEEFEARFESVYGEFHQRLLTAHPNLTPNERRLCAFLRLDMSTKEIALLTGQSVRAVELGRTRLRKKLDLTNSNEGLFEYLSRF